MARSLVPRTYSGCLHTISYFAAIKFTLCDNEERNWNRYFEVHCDLCLVLAGILRNYLEGVRGYLCTVKDIGLKYGWGGTYVHVQGEYVVVKYEWNSGVPSV